LFDWLFFACVSRQHTFAEYLRKITAPNHETQESRPGQKMSAYSSD
jgi:hypothetical protein